MEISLPMTLRPSRLQLLILCCVSALLAVGGLLLISEKPLIGSLVTGFFGICLLVFVVQLLLNSSYLRLTSEGFTVCSLFRIYTIRWTDVSGFSVVRVTVTKMVGWNYAPGYRSQATGRALSKGLAGVEAAFPDSYGMKPEDLAQMMEDFRRQYS